MLQVRVLCRDCGTEGSVGWLADGRDFRSRSVCCRAQMIEVGTSKPSGDVCLATRAELTNERWDDGEAPRGAF